MNISDEDQKPVKSRVPKCSKCRNHKIICEKKGHKGKCNYEECPCPKCRIIDERRSVMRSHIKNRRQLEKQEKIANHQSLLNQLMPMSAPSTPPPPPVTNEIVIRAVTNAISTLPSFNWSLAPTPFNLGTYSSFSELSLQSSITMSGSGLESSETTQDNYLMMDSSNAN